MSNLVRIKDVRFYVGLTEDVAECYSMKMLLESKGIPFTLMAYMDDSAHKELLSGLSTWTWGPEGQKVEIKRFPFVTWINCYDDFETNNDIAMSEEDINLKLEPHKALIK